jgi:hypothetical protein
MTNYITEMYGVSSMLNTENARLNTLLSAKEILGFSFEMQGQELLTMLGISFNGNPTEPLAWKANISHGCDIYTYIFQMEFKVANFTVYPAHVYRHVLTRFNDSDNRTKVVITNNKRNWFKVKHILDANGILLWTLDDLKNYYTTPSFISIFNFINHNVEATSNLYKLNLAKTLELNSSNEKMKAKIEKLSMESGCTQPLARGEHLTSLQLQGGEAHVI